MILSALGESEIAHRLRHDTLVMQSGPFRFRIQSAIEAIAEDLSLLYAPLGQNSCRFDRILN